MGSGSTAGRFGMVAGRGRAGAGSNVGSVTPPPAEVPPPPDVLAERYASAAMVAIWSPGRKVTAERELWLAVLEAQRDLGLDVDPAVIDDYRAVLDTVDLAAIAERERSTRHDVKARIDEFCALAGHEHIHKGMTSRDLTENVEQMQVRESLVVVRDRCVATLARLAGLATRYDSLVMAGRSHNVPAQAVTLGKRLANAGEELLVALERVERERSLAQILRRGVEDGSFPLAEPEVDAVAINALVSRQLTVPVPVDPASVDVAERRVLGFAMRALGAGKL